MNEKSKCIVDNWSLEHAGIVLDNSQDLQRIDNELFENALGGLSNFIDAVLLYDEPNFLLNGFENHWTRFEWFSQNVQIYFGALDPSVSEIDWNSEASYENNGISNYLTTSEIFESDLFIAPERSSAIISTLPKKGKDSLSIILEQIDKSILKRKEESWFKNVRVGIDNNFKLPSLTQFVLSEASTSMDLLEVIMQIKSDGQFERIKNRIREESNETKSAGRLQKNVEDIIVNELGISSSKVGSWSVSIPVMFFTLSKSFHLDFFSRKEHLLFLRSITAIRTQKDRLEKDIERVFGRSI